MSYLRALLEYKTMGTCVITDRRPAPGPHPDRRGQPAAADPHHRAHLRALRRPAAARSGAVTQGAGVHPRSRRRGLLGRAHHPQGGAAQYSAGHHRVPAADDRAQHADRVGPVVPLDWRSAAAGQLGNHRQ